MSKRYTQHDILEMAVNKKEPDLAADVNLDGKITPADARLAPDGVETPDPSMRISDAVLNRLMNEPEYRYDQSSDPLYRQYREIYEKEGGRAAKNAYGLASAYTGGYGSSYAAAAANDAYALYMDKLAAKGEALEQKAYDRHSGERTDLYRLLDAAQGYEDRSYARETDEADRQYARATDAQDRQYRKERDEKDDAYREAEQGRNAVNDMIAFAFNAAGKGDYSYLAALGVDTSSMTGKDALAAAETLAKYGDYSALEKLGVDISSLKEEKAMEKAGFLAGYGDLSGLAALGVDLTALNRRNAQEDATFSAQYGDLSGLAALGVDLTALNRQNAQEDAAFYAKFGDLSGLKKLGVDVSQLKREQLFDIAALFAKYGNYSLLRMLL